MLSLPSIAKIAEIRPRIAVPVSEPTLALNRRRPIGPAYREMWIFEIALAAVSSDNVRKIIAFLERLDGRFSSFALPLGKFSRVASFTASLVAAPATGADRIRLNLSPAAGSLKRGTLLTIGNIDLPDFQLLEVVADAPASADTTVYVAPRIRRKFTTGDAVVIGNVTARVKLAGDEIQDISSNSSGAVQISAVEAP